MKSPELLRLARQWGATDIPFNKTSAAE